MIKSKKKFHEKYLQVFAAALKRNRRGQKKDIVENLSKNRYNKNN